MNGKINRSEYLGNKELESREPFEADLRVDFIRHGKPEYTKEEISTAKIEGRLTDVGKQQIEESAIKLTKEIDKKKELVVIWVSPKRRAQETAKIIRDTFDKEEMPILTKGITTQQLRTQKPLGDVQMTPEFINQLIKEKAVNDWMKYWIKSEKLPEGVEKPEEVKTRLKRIITYLERIARKIYPESGKKLHFICIGHEEIFRDLLNEGYGLGTQKGTGPDYGESLRIDIHKSSEDGDAVLDLKYRNQDVKLGFKKDERKIYKMDSKSSSK